MALIIEDGSIVPNADSYIDTAFVDQYNEDYLGNSSWIIADQTTKERACRSATQAIDSIYGTSWKGYRTDDTQTLDWPRRSVTNCDGITLASNEMPLRLKQATADLAIKGISEVLIPDLDVTGTLKKTKVKLDVIEEANEYFSAIPVKDRKLANSLLSDYLTSCGLHSANVRICRS